MEHRRTWLADTVNRFEAASGATVDNTRLAVIAAELDRSGYTRAQATAAEAWITRGNPARFGSLTLPDFFPTPEQLATIAYDAAAGLRAEYARGFDAGRSVGIAEERAAWEHNEAYLRLCKDAARPAELDAREAVITSREQALAEASEAVAKREWAVARAMRRLERYPAPEAEPALHGAIASEGAH